MTLENDKLMVLEWMGHKLERVFRGFNWYWLIKDRDTYLTEWNPHQDRNQLAEVLEKIMNTLELYEIIGDKHYSEGAFIFNYIKYPNMIWRKVVKYVKTIKDKEESA